MKIVLPILFSILLLLGAVNHIISPDFYRPMIPDFLPSWPVNVSIAMVEAVIGVALLLKPYRKMAGLAFMILMLAFLPIHIWDLVKETPAVGSTTNAWIRLAVQFVLIYGGWWIWRKYD